MNRYEVGGVEGQFEPGSSERVLVNKLGITSPHEMEDVELELLEKLYNAVLGGDFPDRGLGVDDLKQWHYRWLGNVYEWAGRERSVNVAKGDFPFAAAEQVPRLLKQFETQYLNHYTPCHELSRPELVEAIAITHVELVLIHPFREGNGRLARLLADVMAVQAGHDLLDYSRWNEAKQNYFSAIQQGMAGNYESMFELVDEALVA